MLNKIKTKIANRIIKIIDSRFLLKIEPKINRIAHDIDKFQKSKIEGVLIKGKDVTIDNTSILIVKNDTILNLEGENYIGRDVELQPDSYISIGYGTSIQDRNILLGDIKIGRFCLTAPNVYMSSGNHFYNVHPEIYIKDQDKEILEKNNSSILSHPIVIEDDVWIGINSVIMRGVRIGKGAIIGSNTVVTKNVNPYEVVVGNPSRVIKNRLEFKPKKKLLFSNVSDLPYFYSGFLLDKKNLNKSILLGGIYASPSFRICVDCLNCKSVSIKLKNITNKDVVLVYKDLSFKLSSEKFEVIDFHYENQENFIDFYLKDINIEYKPFLLINEVKLYEK